ncbi:MAG TPA: FlgD immunoglobulin-like domain containing protein [bacterium]|nr:FlgD immunoglobulin-like domain containing protein [bacterium]HOC24654.1 FlgD immunoglobulin-like domain containing protein [bacterium]HOH07059.1 FlgD immunoglobulin-like domain containing protein [bacterium]
MTLKKFNSLTFQPASRELLGEAVATLHQGILQAGKHRLIWAGNDEAGRQAPAGVYIIRMTAPGFSASRKVLLLR